MTSFVLADNLNFPASAHLLLLDINLRGFWNRTLKTLRVSLALTLSIRKLAVIPMAEDLLSLRVRQT